VSTSNAGEPLCEILEWDSRHFGLRIGRVHAGALLPDRLEAVRRWRQAQAVDCLYLLVPIDSAAGIRMAEDLDFRLVDVRTTLERPVTADAAAPPRVRTLQRDDIPLLTRMAGDLHSDSRFFVDSRFPAAKSRAMFETWMSKACIDPSYRVLVADEGGRVAGYVACQMKDEGVGQIQLIAVDRGAQGAGLGRQLVSAALEQLARDGATRARVVTQGRNLAALRLYQRHGFVTVSQELWYHWWSCERHGTEPR
jgi:ribosomal protein S18 acetylase RimI-like enzyme